MSDAEVITTTLREASRRQRKQRLWQGIWNGLLWGAMAWLVALLAYKFLPLSPVTLLVGAGLFVIALLAGLLAGLRHLPTKLENARWLDARQELQERISSAVELSQRTGESEWSRLVVADAAQQCQQIDFKRLFPVRLPVAARYALLVLALGAGLGFVPEYRSQKYLTEQKDRENIQQTGKQLAELTRLSLSNRPPHLETTRDSLEKLATLADQLAERPVLKAEAVRELANKIDQLKEQLQPLEKDPALRRMEQAARSEGSNRNGETRNDVQKQIQDLEQALGDKGAAPEATAKLEKQLEATKEAAAKLNDKDPAVRAQAQADLADALSELAKQSDELGWDLGELDAAMAALKKGDIDQLQKDLAAAFTDLDQLADMAKKLEQLREMAKRMGKDLGEQLENGQVSAAKRTLEKMAAKLKSGEISEEELKQLMEEVSRAIPPALDYGEVSEKLRQALKKLLAGEKQPAAESLQAAADELEELIQQLTDCESLREALDALERARLAIGTGKCMGQCRGAGTGQSLSWWSDQPNNQAGLGTNPHNVIGKGDPTLPENLEATKVKGQISAEAPLPSITLKGVSIKGQSSVKFEEAAAAAQADAQSALNQDQVPKAYRQAVRDYFDDLKRPQNP